ncbi:hypothetical protein, partial [Caldilinea sp.]|uniref:hypothetical protein n=1 Tax=Caldilinea sp. TaxID=2293560 RepID=UPI002CD4B340|nr:hypothetical protein [Caldilinea sp.]
TSRNSHKATKSTKDAIFNFVPLCLRVRPNHKVLKIAFLSESLPLSDCLKSNHEVRKAAQSGAKRRKAAQSGAKKHLEAVSAILLFAPLVASWWDFSNSLSAALRQSCFQASPSMTLPRMSTI